MIGDIQSGPQNQSVFCENCNSIISHNKLRYNAEGAYYKKNSHKGTTI
jgi:hypothetical protein